VLTNKFNKTKSIHNQKSTQSSEPKTKSTQQNTSTAKQNQHDNINTTKSTHQNESTPKQNQSTQSTRGGGLGSSTIFKKFNETYAPS